MNLPKNRLEELKVGVLIPTKDRPKCVEQLLISLLNSTVKPTQIVIVSSGENISDVVGPFQEFLHISYVHSSTGGQVYQKMVGIRLLSPELDWVMFLDDDVLVDANCIANALHEIERLTIAEKRNVAGVGLALPSLSRANHVNPIVKIIGKIFLISNEKPGHVYLNGHAASYSNSKEILTTEWLNGASIWKLGSVRNYGAGIISTKYAACEDLIFSYYKRHKGELVYLPNARLAFQKENITDFEKYEVFCAAALWRLYFILTNTGFSRVAYLYSQIGRILFGISKTKELKALFVVKCIKLWMYLLYLSIFPKRINQALKKI